MEVLAATPQIYPYSVDEDDSMTEELFPPATMTDHGLFLDFTNSGSTLGIVMPRYRMSEIATILGIRFSHPKTSAAPLDNIPMSEFINKSWVNMLVGRLMRWFSFTFKNIL